MKKLLMFLFLFSCYSNASWVLRDHNNVVIPQQYIAICYHYYSKTINDSSSEVEMRMQEMYNFHYNRTTEIGLEFEKFTIKFEDEYSRQLTKELCSKMYFLNESEYLFEQYLETGK